jgi:hypothetical protein
MGWFVFFLQQLLTWLQNPKNAHIHNACTVVFIGGTGGRDTAGLGGKGGPYRLVRLFWGCAVYLFN